MQVRNFSKKRGAVDAIMMSEYMDVANEDDDVKEERKRVNDIMAGNMPDSEVNNRKCRSMDTFWATTTLNSVYSQ